MSENVNVNGNLDENENENDEAMDMKDVIVIFEDELYPGESRVSARKAKMVGGVQKVIYASVSLPNIKLRKDNPTTSYEELLQYHIATFGLPTVYKLMEKALIINAQDIVRTLASQDRIDELRTLRTSYKPLMSVSSRTISVTDSAKNVMEKFGTLDDNTRKELTKSVFQNMLSKGEITSEQFAQYCQNLGLSA